MAVLRCFFFCFCFQHKMQLSQLKTYCNLNIFREKSLSVEFILHASMSHWFITYARKYFTFSSNIIWYYYIRFWHIISVCVCVCNSFTFLDANKHRLHGCLLDQSKWMDGWLCTLHIDRFIFRFLSFFLSFCKQ